MKEVIFNRGPESDVIISSRVRLARNLSDFPFPIKMNQAQSEEVLSRIKDVLIDSSNNFQYINTGDLTELELFSMVEMHLVSTEFALSKRPRGIILSDNDIISIMINEEDHVRIQAIASGLQLENVWKMCLDVDNSLDDKLNIAFNETFGYLTSCPTNVGTGMRVSTMIHLPALVATGYISKILEVCNKIGITVRGLYGEHSKAYGNIFQVSNQVTLGLDENEIMLNVNNIVKYIIEQERLLRNELYKQNPKLIEDKLYRSYGIFSNARILTSEEAFKLISDVKLGIDMGIIKDVDIEKINEIMLFMQPANLQRISGEVLDNQDVNVKRAEMVRKILKG